jgi:DNA-directed RNA polymerase specialized sigma24 family protein
MFTNFFKRLKKEKPQTPKKEEKADGVGFSSTTPTASETSIEPLILSLSEQLKEHDKHLTEHDASVTHRFNRLEELVEASKETMLSRLRPSTETTETTESTPSATLKERLKSLSHNEQKLLALLLHEEYLTYRDIAEQTGLNANTVKDIVNRSQIGFWTKKHDEKGRARISLSDEVKEATIRK